MPEVGVERLALIDEVSHLGQLCRPDVGCVALDGDDRTARRSPRVEPGVGTLQGPAPRKNGLSRRLLVVEQSSDDLQLDLRLGVAAHRSDRRRERAIGVGEHARAQRVRRAAAGGDLGGVSVVDREPEATVVQVDAGRRFDEPGTEVRGVRLNQRHSHPVAVDGAQICGVTGCDRSPSAARPLRINRLASRVEPRRRQQRVAVGPLVQCGRSVETGRGGRLDQQVGPAWIARVVGQFQPGGDQGPGEREVAL